MNLAFNAERHEYRLDGEYVPNVTRIIAPLHDFDGIPRDVLEHKRQVGEAVHAAIQLDLADDLDQGSVDPAISGYLIGWDRFRAENRFECQFSERMVYSGKYRYAGTLDLIGTVGEREALLDVKCTAGVHPAVGLQLAAYLHAASEAGLIRSSASRYALQLKPDGTYALVPFTDKTDFAVFLSLLSAHNWSVRRGLLKEHA